MSAHNSALPNIPQAEIMRCLEHAGWIMQVMRIEGEPHPHVYASRCDEVSDWRFVEHDRSFPNATPALVKVWAEGLSTVGVGRQWFDDFKISPGAFAR